MFLDQGDTEVYIITCEDPCVVMLANQPVNEFLDAEKAALVLKCLELIYHKARCFIISKITILFVALLARIFMKIMIHHCLGDKSFLLHLIFVKFSLNH